MDSQQPPDGGAVSPRPNRLAHATSPYLRQHANNPVDWYEWGPEALERAVGDDRPILLSVGYSACHWCHVMAHESFEDEATARVMNEHFVNIKVDREERPDIDAIYQKVVQLMGQGGGWPLTVFLTPDQKPFYGGTYFPPRPLHGRPAFSQVLHAVSDLYRDRRKDVEDQTGEFMRGLAGIAASLDHGGDGANLTTERALDLPARRLVERIDPNWGGFGSAPKFPNPTALDLLLRMARDPGTAIGRECRDAVRLTLERMWRGGIYDHLRGGFARYAVDREWLVPHFEKMLYDNAQLLGLYAEAAVLWPDDRFLRDVVGQTVDYLEADMLAPSGLFYASTDADSEGHEGKFFCWTPAEIAEVLGSAELASLFGQVYGVTKRGNFAHGWSILNLPRTLGLAATDLGVDLDDLRRRLAAARERLLEHRYTRVAPHRDEKVVTGWNALMVSGLCRAAAAACEWDGPLATRCQDLASTCCATLLADHVADDGKVRRAGFEGRVHTRAVLDDVAFLARACLDLHELTLAPRWLDEGVRLARHAVAHHARDGGGFFLTADDAETLIERTESQHDSAIPSGVGALLEVLARLDGADRLDDASRVAVESTLARFSGAVAQPFAYASVLTAASVAASHAAHVTIRAADPGSKRAQAMANVARMARMRTATAISLSFEPADADASAVICRGQVCTAPLRELDTIRQQLGQPS